MSASRFAPPALICATPFEWREPSLIPIRQWIFGRHAQRRYVSVTGGEGGTGKTALVMAESLSVVTGRPLLSDGKVERARVWYLGLEDDRLEYERRIAATVLAHNLDPDSLRGGFFWDSGRNQNFTIATEERGMAQVSEPVVKAIAAQIRLHDIGLLIVDPFLGSHGVSENDNGKIDYVMRQWAAIAEETGCAIELIHHLRKSGSQSGADDQTADRLRGAGSLVGAARSVRLLVGMTKDEAKRFGVDNRRRYFQVMSGTKANMALHDADGAWRELLSITLGNGDVLHPADLVQAATVWRPPDASSECSAEDFETICARIAAGEFRQSVQAKDWVGKPVAEVLGIDLDDGHGKESVKRALAGWIERGDLVVNRRKDDSRRERIFVEVPPNV